MTHELIRDFCLSKPGGIEEFPWGQATFKVGGKMFCGVMGMGFRIMLKATHDQQEALTRIPGIERAPYLGNQGWILVDFEHFHDDEMALDLVEESYRQVVEKLPKSKRPSA